MAVRHRELWPHDASRSFERERVDCDKTMYMTTRGVDEIELILRDGLIPWEMSFFIGVYFASGGLPARKNKSTLTEEKSTSPELSSAWF